MTAQRPLAGLRVLDLSRALSGPFAGRILADLGADVVKVELPGADIAQTYGQKTRGRSGLYAQLNVGKPAMWTGCSTWRPPATWWWRTSGPASSTGTGPAGRRCPRSTSGWCCC